jgi:hypothetical protein
MEAMGCEPRAVAVVNHRDERVWSGHADHGAAR